MDKINDQRFQSAFANTRVQDVMYAPVPTLLVTENLSKAAEIFFAYPVFHLPIVDEDNRLVGILSHKYLYKTEAPRKFIDDEMKTSPGMVMDRDGYFWKESLDRYILRRVMNPNPPTLKPEDPLLAAVELMARRGLGCVPVVNQKKEVLGLISSQEVFNFTADLLR